MTAPSLFREGDNRSIEPPRAESRQEETVTNSNHFSSTESLYRKYRPQSFGTEELVGQAHVVRTLQNAVSRGRVAHAYLFSGPRGTGKTTTARLLAKAVNCSHDDPAARPCNACANCEAINKGATPDIIEIDAASNRGIDDIRDLRERVRYAPAQLPSKVYIIDEAHQITGAAANAFLKTLEEPPAHTRFILATTDPEELLPTIVSRCQRFEFRRVSTEDSAHRLRTVANLEGISATDDALRLIARHATGSLRDALGLLEQLSLLTTGADGPSQPETIETSHVQAALGLSRNERVEDLVEAISQRDAGAALRIVQAAIDEGDDARQLNRQLVGYLRLLLLERSGGSAEADSRAKELAAAFSVSEIAVLARRFAEIDFSIKHSPYPQLPLEVALVESSAEAEVAADPLMPPVSEHDVAAPKELVRPTSLRDRVRGASSIRESPSSHIAKQAASPEAPPVTHLRAVSPQPGIANAVQAGPRSMDVEQIADLWPRVRGDVKAVNRRIEALLSEVDPVAISGNLITLAVPYPFHRDKLNSDDVRDLVANVLSRLLDQEIVITCILRGELAATGNETQAAVDTVTTPDDEPRAVSEPNADTGEDERTRDRIRAAKNIFDAEVVDEPASARLQVPADPA